MSVDQIIILDKRGNLLIDWSYKNSIMETPETIEDFLQMKILYEKNRKLPYMVDPKGRIFYYEYLNDIILVLICSCD